MTRHVAAYIRELAEGGARAAKHTTCPRCGQPTITGDDHDRAAARATVDPEPVDPIGEMLAILDGRTTYDLIKTTGRAARPGVYDLHIRETWHVHSTHPARYPVHAQHRCDPGRRHTLW